MERSLGHLVPPYPLWSKPRSKRNQNSQVRELLRFKMRPSPPAQLSAQHWTQLGTLGAACSAATLARTPNRTPFSAAQSLSAAFSAAPPARTPSRTPKLKTPRKDREHLRLKVRHPLPARAPSRLTAHCLCGLPRPHPGPHQPYLWQILCRFHAIFARFTSRFCLIIS